ncbi:MAG: hypothetical protein LBQ65_08995, partial [Tannerellaceae bacterium]|nr:hypothetical protein [Tannerellaceae bacterium]
MSNRNCRKKPTGKLGGELSLGYGSYNRKLADGFINTPILSDKLLNRFAFTFEDRDGYIKNLSGGDLNGKNVYALFPDIPALSGGKPNYVSAIPDIRGTMEQALGAPLEMVFASLDVPTRQQLIGVIDMLSNAPLNAYHEEAYKNSA